MESYIVKEYEVYDGDTIKCVFPLFPLPLRHMAIRIRGIDTPEIRTKNETIKAMGKTVKEYVKNLLSKEDEIHILRVEKGKYFRLVADVYLPKQNIYVAQRLLDLGFALPYDGKKKPDWEAYL